MIRRMFITAVLAGAGAAPALAADLDIEVRGIRSGDGRLYVAVHTSESKSEFPAASRAFATIQRRAQTGTLRFVLRDLPAGRYAVNAFHDENDNGDLDTNLIDIPSEGYGFANDPNTSFGPAKFDAAAVDVGDAAAVAAMTLRYRLRSDLQ